MHVLLVEDDALIPLGAGQMPDVIATDIGLGHGLNGFDLAEMARSRHPAVEVILISGSTPHARGRPLRRHARFLQNPFDTATLSAAIRAAGRGEP